MVGMILKWGSKVVLVTADTLEIAEHVAIELLAEIGIDAVGEEVTMVVFNPTEPGGVIIETASQAMDGWSVDGFDPSPPESGQ